MVLNNLLKIPFGLVIPVLNGCTDLSLQEVLRFRETRIRAIIFNQPLGIDIPRAIGTAYALKLGCEGVIYVDGDMTGNFQSHLSCLIDALKAGIDLALVNCYPYITDRQKLTQTVLYFRGRLNRELGLFQDLGLATPTHGPHAVSKKLLEAIPLRDLAVPPMVLAKARKNQSKIKVVTSIPHSLLSSPTRERGHAHKIAHTIIGDSLEALSYAAGNSPSRSFGKHIFDGYNSERRFDLLAKWGEQLGIQALC